MGKHHRDEDDDWPQWKCGYCGDIFEYLGDKIRHVNIIHQNFPPPREEESASIGEWKASTL